MTPRSTLPLAGVGIALATCAVVLLAGGNPWLTGGIALVWVASLWLSAAPPATASRAPAEGVQLTLGGISGLIEHSGVAMLMLEDERIVVANAAAREALGAHIVGQDARVAFRHPAAVALLAQPNGGSVTIDGLTGPRSSWRLTRQTIDERLSFVEMLDRAAEADVSRAHTDFVANASHELRTPLSSIIGYVETLIDAGDKVDPQQAARFHETVLNEARRLQALVQDLMSLSRIEAEKHDQPREPVDLGQLAASVGSEISAARGEGRVVIEWPRRAATIAGDRAQLDQLVRNLVDNALKYGDPQEPVRVIVEAENGEVGLTVEDRGPGIAPEHLPHLTRRFYRTDPGRSRAAGGTGLGLAIVKHIVERHRGKLDIASRVGQGTTVSVRFAAHEAE